jgi:thiosulfate reductase/polysulfide reductase chain A
MSLSRRQFIRLGAASSAALAVGGGLVSNWGGLDAPRLPDPATEGDRVVPTFCELCFWKCGVLAHVRDDRVTKITGNPAHPLSRGRLCPRGAGGPGALYDPDRLKTPLARVRKRGEDVFEPISWKEALDRVADEMRKVKEEHGPEAFALFQHGYGSSWFRTLFQAYGSPNVAAPSYAQCRGPREAGFIATFGDEVGSPERTDMEHADCVVLVGSHLGENMHNTQVQDFARAIGRGATIIVVDPRFSVAASKARWWLPIKPGTDLALLLAWTHVIVTEKLYDADYVGAHATGLGELAAHVADKTPEWAWPITGIDPDLIRNTARAMAAARPAVVLHPGRRVVWYGDDTQRSRAIAILTALLGAWGRRGGYLVPESMPLPRLTPCPLPRVEKPASDRERPEQYPLADEALASGLRDSSIPGRGLYDIRAWMIYGTNLPYTLPRVEDTIRALEGLDFVVAIDVLPAEICGWADIVLPECTYLERWDELHAPAYKEPYVALRQEVVRPMYGSRPGYEIARELAERLGLGAFLPWPDARSYLEERVKAAGLDWEALCRTGVLGGQPRPSTFEDGVPAEFGTESGKIELFSPSLASMGFDPAPVYRPPDAAPPGAFRLLVGRTPTHTFSRTSNNRLLSEIIAENELWLHTLPAKDMGLSGGDRVMVTNQDGVEAGPMRVKVTERIRPECVYMAHGFGHTANGLGFTRGRGVNDNLLMTRVKVDPLMGGTGISDNFVTLRRA